MDPNSHLEDESTGDLANSIEKLDQDESNKALEEVKSSAVPLKRDALNNLQVYAYAMSLIGNEMSSTMWSSFFSLYLKDIVGVSGDIVGAAILIGQIMGGLMTPITSFLVSVFHFGRFG